MGVLAQKNANSRLVLYADRIKGSIRTAMEKMQERQELQMAYTKSWA
jgi:excinuclease UvrABC helicase subunit UvrB